MRTLAASLAEREPRRPRTEFGVDSLKLTKLTLSDNIEAFMMTFERSMEAHEIERVKWLVLLAPQLTGKAQQAYAALSSEDSKNFTKVKEAIFKYYDINEETYRQRFRSSKVKEGESPTEIVTRLTDMAVRWLKEHDTRAKVIDMVVMEQFITMLLEEIRVWVKEHKPETSMIAGKFAEDYQQARKTAEDDQVGSKEKPPEGGRRCLVCCKTGPFARECPNKTHKLRSGSTDRQLNSANREESSRQPVLRCYTCDGKGHTSKQCPSKALFCGNRNKPRGAVEGTVLRQGVVNGFMVDDLLLDTGCSKTIVRRDLVGEEQWLGGESTIIRCAHGDAIAYPLAAIELEIQGKSVLVNSAVSDTLPQSVLVGTDVLGLLEMLQTSGTEKEEPLEKALVVMTKSRTRGQPTEETTEPGIVSDNVGSIITEFNFDDELFSQDKLTNPKLTKSQKRQPWHEHTKEQLRQKAGLGMSVAQFCELQESDPSLEKFRKGSGKGSCFKQNGLWYHKWTPKPYRGYSVNQLLLPVQCRQKVLQLAHSIPLAGHMGRDRTLQRIQQRFYWPSLFHAVDSYCRSCPECQKVSTPRQHRVPLIPLPVMKEPFERITIDIVGPLPRSRKGYQYVLVICDYATRYPEAIPLRLYRCSSSS